MAILKNLRIIEFFERTSNQLRMKLERNSKNLNQLRIHGNFFEVHNSWVSNFRSSTASNFENFENSKM